MSHIRSKPGNFHNAIGDNVTMWLGVEATTAESWSVIYREQLFDGVSGEKVTFEGIGKSGTLRQHTSSSSKRGTPEIAGLRETFGLAGEPTTAWGAATSQ